MKRIPSLHITSTLLNKLIEEWFDRHNIGKSSESLVDHLLSNGVRHTLTHRKKLDTYNNGTKSKSFQLKSSSIEDARLFAGLLKKVREQRKHRGVTRIREGSSEWGLLKEATGKAKAFVSSYKLGIRQGFLRYLTLYIDYASTTAGAKNQRFDIRGIPSRHGLICDIHDALTTIESDTDAEATKRAHDVYSGLVSERTGIPINYTKEPLKYVYFTYAAKLCKNYGLSPAEYIKAQFKALDWTNGIPIPSQLVSKNAEERTVKYMAENGIKKVDRNDPNHMSEKQMSEFWKRVKATRDEDTN